MYMSLDGSLPEARAMESDEAAAELARRFFTSRGPATLQDFVWWSGLSAVDARIGLEATGPHLVQETIGSRTYWLSRPMPTARDSSSVVYLLPGFDEYLLSYRDRSASLDLLHAKALNAGGGVLRPTIVAEGRVIGTWKCTFEKDTAAIMASPFAALSEAQSRALSAAVERTARS